MNLPRVVVAAIVAWLAFVAIASVVHGVLMADLYARGASGIRPGGEAHPAVGFGVALLGFFAFAYSYAKGYEGGRGTQEGMRFGVLVALMLVSFAAVWTYVVFPVSGRLAATLAIDYVVEFAIYGMIVGAIYKPAAGAGRGGRVR